MKKTVIFCILLLTVVLLIGCKKTTVYSGEDQETEAQPETPPAAEEPVIEQPAPIETLSEIEMVREARCIDGKIEAVLTNPTEEVITLGANAKVIINGLIIVDPECDDLELEPGEMTFCTDISGHIEPRVGTTNKVQINMMSERSLSVIDCTE